MKLTTAIFALLLLFITSCGHSPGVSEPEDVGEQVTDILSDLDDMSEEEFGECFMSLEDIRELGEDDDVIKDKDMRNRLTKMTKEDRNKGIERAYERLKEKGKEFKIVWDEIEMDDFSYEVESEKGMKVCEGNLMIKQGGKKYRIRTVSLFDGSDYNLIEMRGPYKED